MDINKLQAFSTLLKHVGTLQLPSLAKTASFREPVKKQAFEKLSSEKVLDFLTFYTPITINTYRR